MKSFTTDRYGRTIIIHLGKGEKVLESITAELKRLDVNYGILVSAIGSLRKACLHVITNTDDLSVNKYITVEKPIELGAAQGLIIDGEPHFHLNISEPEHLYSGHMENECEVQYLAEFAILELKDLNITRKLDSLGISYLAQKY